MNLTEQDGSNTNRIRNALLTLNNADDTEQQPNFTPEINVKKNEEIDDTEALKPSVKN
jgi:hypothetical protein